MKRRGFTLVELLIVIAILGILSSIMMLNVTGSTGKAKAMTIANNVNACRNAASLYYGQELLDSGATTAKTAEVLAKYVGSWLDFANGATIKYTVADDSGQTGEGKGDAVKYDVWAIQVDFHSDGDASDITTHLTKIPGFSTIGANNNFTIKLWDGTVTAGAKISG